MKTAQEKEVRQEILYSFPYHYLPHLEDNGVPRITRDLSWGFEYLTYILAIQAEINAVLPINGSILDVGCGDGFLLNTMHAGPKKHGIDLSARAIVFAKAFSKDAVFDVCDTKDINREYDVVTCVEVLEHIPDSAINDFVTSIKRLVKPAGYLIVSVPTTVVKLNKKHYRHYDEELLSLHMELGPGFELVKEQRIYRTSRLLTLINRLLYNKFFTVNFAPILKFFWAWHCRSNILASKKNGSHLIWVIKKS